jgi:hypothetical protein
MSKEQQTTSSKRRKPTSRKKILANIENSKKSTGPTSAQGKWRSAQNPIVNMLYTKMPLLMFESPQEREELAEVITSNLRPFTPVQEFRVSLIIDRVWIIMRNNRMKVAYLNHEVTSEVIGRKFLSGEYEPSDYEEKREEILAKHGKEIVPTERDVQNVLHRLFDDRNDLIWKMDKMSLQNERALTRLLDDFDRLQKDERCAKKEAKVVYEEARLNDPEPWEGQSMDLPDQTQSNNSCADGSGNEKS